MSEEMNVQDFCTDEEEVLPITPAENEEPAAEDDYYEQDTSKRIGIGAGKLKGVEFFFDEDEPAAEEQTADETAQEQTAPEQAADAGLFVLIAEQNAVLKEQLAAMDEKLDRLTAQLVSTNRAVAMHETIEGNLNKELQSYKNDFYGKLATPFLMQLISLHNEMDKEISELKDEMAASEQPTGHEDVVMSLEYYMEKILGSLTNSGVEIHVPEVGGKIDPIEQRIVKTVPSDDPEQNGIIESVRSNAYIYHGKILLPAKVTVYKA